MPDEGLGMHAHFDASDFDAALDRLEVQADVATELAVRRGIAYFVRAAMEHSPVAKSVKEPRHVGGTLRRSIRIVSVMKIGARWVATAGPAIIYGRFRDLGGTIHAKGNGYLKFQINGGWVQVREVTQRGSFFMEHGLEDTEEVFNDIYAQAWAQTVRG